MYSKTKEDITMECLSKWWFHALFPGIPNNKDWISSPTDIAMFFTQINGRSKLWPSASGYSFSFLALNMFCFFYHFKILHLHSWGSMLWNKLLAPWIIQDPCRYEYMPSVSLSPDQLFRLNDEETLSLCGFAMQKKSLPSSLSLAAGLVVYTIAIKVIKLRETKFQSPPWE